jgi:hypothetical protein
MIPRVPSTTLELYFHLYFSIFAPRSETTIVLGILPRSGAPFGISSLGEKEYVELAGALLESGSITHLLLWTDSYTKELRRQCQSTCAPASACNAFNGPENGSEMMEKCIVVFMPQFKKARRLRNYNSAFLSRVGRPPLRSKTC